MNFLNRQTPKERLIELIQRFEIKKTPLETTPSNSMGSSAARGYGTVVPHPDAEEYQTLKNEFAVDLLTRRATYLPLDEHRSFFASVAQETTNGRNFMDQHKYSRFDNVPQQTGGRRTKRKRRKHKTKRY